MSRMHGVPFAQTPEWLLDADVSDRAIRLFAILTRYAGEKDRAFPGRPKIAERCRCSVNSIDRAMAELVEVHAIVIEPHYRPDGSRTSNSYWIWPAVPEEGCPQGGGGVAPPVGRGAPTDGEASRNDSQRNERQGKESQASVPAARKQPHRLPEQFLLTAEMHAWAADHVPAIDARLETAQFCDYWRSAGGSSALKLDWTAAWRVWMRKATPRRQANGHSRATGIDAVAEYARQEGIL